MPLPAIIGHTGSVSGTPAQATSGVPSLQEILNTSFTSTFASSKSARPAIVGATDASPFVLALETITKVRFMAMRVRGGTLKVVVTSAAGTDQAFNLSDVLVWHSPNSGDELTAVKLVGTADLEYVLAGDVS